MLRKLWDGLCDWMAGRPEPLKKRSPREEVSKEELVTLEEVEELHLPQEESATNDDCDCDEEGQADPPKADAATLAYYWCWQPPRDRDRSLANLANVNPKLALDLVVKLTRLYDRESCISLVDVMGIAKSMRGCTKDEIWQGLHVLYDVNYHLYDDVRRHLYQTRVVDELPDSVWLEHGGEKPPPEKISNSSEVDLRAKVMELIRQARPPKVEPDKGVIGKISGILKELEELPSGWEKKVQEDPYILQANRARRVMDATAKVEEAVGTPTYERPHTTNEVVQAISRVLPEVRCK